MKKRLEEIEQSLMNIYVEIKKEIPNLNDISFEIIEYPGNPKPALYGFYHIGKVCKPYDNIAELATLVTEVKERRAKNEILYQRFGRIE